VNAVHADDGIGFKNFGNTWDQAGAEFVGDVAPYELMKLRLLNGAHSTLAYLGYLIGRRTEIARSSEFFIDGGCPCRKPNSAGK
jgi:hypothetical protein